MYQLLSVIAKGQITGYRYVSIETENVPLSKLFTLYTKVFLILRTPYLEGNQNVDLDSLRTLYNNSPLTINEFLTQNGNSVLTTVDVVPSITTKLAVYSDAVFAGYKINQCRMPISTDQNLPEMYKKDLFISSESRDATLLHQYALMSVNGFIHNTDMDSKYTYVIDGAKSFFHCNLNHVGITSFYNIGKLTKVRITENMIYKAEDKPLVEKCYFKLDNKLDISNKVVFLVVGGYLILPSENVFFQTTDRTLVLNLQALPYLERLLESYKQLDLKSIGIVDNFTKDQVSTDAFVKRYLTISQSFIVVVDTSDIFYSKISLRNNNFHGIYTSEQEPELPLFTGYGKLTEYWKTQEEGMWSLNCRNTQTKNYLFSSLIDQDKRLILERELTRDKIKANQAFLLEIGTNF